MSEGKFLRQSLRIFVILFGLYSIMADFSSVELHANEPSVQYMPLSGVKVQPSNAVQNKSLNADLNQPYSKAHRIWIDVELWEADGPLMDPNLQAVPYRLISQDTWSERLGWWRQFEEMKNNPQQKNRRFGFTRIFTQNGVLATQILGAGPDGQLTILSERNDKEVLHLCVTPKLTGEAAILLDCKLDYFEHYEGHQSGGCIIGNVHSPLGKMSSMQFVQKLHTGKEKTWTVVMFPRLINETGTDVLVPMPAPQSCSFSDDLDEVFVPRPGRFEMRVQQGWVGRIHLGRIATIRGKSRELKI